MEDPRNSQTGSVFCSFGPTHAGHTMFIQVLPSICGIRAVLCLYCSTAKNVKHSCFPRANEYQQVLSLGFSVTTCIPV